MRIIYTALIASVLSISACAEASPSSEQTKAAEIPATGNWDIVSDESYIRFTALQEGKPFEGSFGEFSGVIAFDPAAPEDGAVRIEIPLSSIEAGSKDRNSTLPGKVWFSTKAFPTAVFESDTITGSGEDFVAEGTLSMKGASMPYSLPFTLKVTGDRAVMQAKSGLDRTRWDVGADPWNTDEWVSQNVDLDIQVTADRR